MREAATISLALKIFFIPWAERILCLYTLCCAPMSLLVRGGCAGGSRRPVGRRHLASAADDLLLLDLIGGEAPGLVVPRRVLTLAGEEVLLDLIEDARELLLGRGLELAGGARSEERRVGKEGRAAG